MRLMPSFLAAVPALVLLSSCVGPGDKPAPAVPAPSPPAPRSAPAPVPADPPAPPPAGTEWSHRPATPGTWSYRSDAAGTLAAFGAPASDPRLTVRCDRATRRISLVRAGQGQGNMIVRTTYGAQSWPTTTAAAPLPRTIATRAASDTGLDQIAYSRGKFAVEVAGLDPLILPAWAEVARVIEDCRG